MDADDSSGSSGVPSAAATPAWSRSSRASSMTGGADSLTTEQAELDELAALDDEDEEEEEDDYEDEDDFSDLSSSSGDDEEEDAPPTVAAAPTSSEAAAAEAAAARALAQAAQAERDAALMAQHGASARSRHWRSTGTGGVFPAPSLSLQRQVAEAQQAAMRLAEQRKLERRQQRQQQRQEQEKSAQREATEAASSDSAVVQSAPTTTAAASLAAGAAPSVADEMQRMQVWARVASVLSLDGEITCSALSSDGSLLATACGRTVHVWLQPGHVLLATLVAPSPSASTSTRTAANAASATVRLLRFTPWSAALARAQPASRGYALLAAGDDSGLANGGGARVWNLATARVGRTLIGHRDRVLDAQFATKGDVLFTASADGSVLAWEWASNSSNNGGGWSEQDALADAMQGGVGGSGRLLGCYAREGSGVRSLALMEDASKLVLASGSEGRASVWDLVAHTRLGDVLEPDAHWASTLRAKHGATNGGWIDGQKFHTGSLNSLCISRDGALLATASADATVKLWSLLSLRRDAASMHNAARYAQERNRNLPHLIPLQDGDTDNKDNRAHHHDDDEEDDDGAIYKGSSNSNGNTASTSSGNSGSSLNLEGEEAPLDVGFRATLLHTLRHMGSVSFVCLTPDGSFVISAGGEEDRAVKVWVADTGKQVYQINLPATIKGMQLVHNDALFEPRTALRRGGGGGGGGRGNSGSGGNERYFFLGRLAVTMHSRVLQIDLAVLESTLPTTVAATAATKGKAAGARKTKAAASATLSLAGGSPNTWPSPDAMSAAAAAAMAARRARRRARRRRDRAIAAATAAAAATSLSGAGVTHLPQVESDALATQYLPGVAKLRASMLAAAAGQEDGAGGVAVATQQVSSAPVFLQQLLSSPGGSSVDRAQLARNMHHYGLTSSFLLRLLTQVVHFRPLQVLHAFARPIPECNPVFKAAFAGIPIDAAMIDMGFLPATATAATSAGGRAAGAASLSISSSAATSNCASAAAGRADPAVVFSAPSSVRGLAPTPSVPSAIRFIELGGGGPSSSSSSSSALSGSSGEALFYATERVENIMSPRPAPAVPTLSSAAAAATAAVLAEERAWEKEEALARAKVVQWQPATQLNLLAHLTSNLNNSSITAQQSAIDLPVHMVHKALGEHQQRFPLFSLSSLDAADARARLAEQQSDHLDDPYGGSRAAQQREAKRHAAAAAVTAARGHPGTQAPNTLVHKGNTLTQARLLGAPSAPPAISPLQTTQPEPPHMQQQQQQQQSRHHYASVISRQLMPNGRRVADTGAAGAAVVGSSTARGARQRLALASCPAASGSQSARGTRLTTESDTATPASGFHHSRGGGGGGGGWTPVPASQDPESKSALDQDLYDYGFDRDNNGDGFDHKLSLPLDTLTLTGGTGTDAAATAQQAEPAVYDDANVAGSTFKLLSPSSSRVYAKPSRVAVHARTAATLASFSSSATAPVALGTLLDQFSASAVEQAARTHQLRVRHGGEVAAKELALSLAPSAGATAGASSANRQAALRLRNIRDGEFRAEMRATLLHQGNSLAALDVDLTGGERRHGGGGGGGGAAAYVSAKMRRERGESDKVNAGAQGVWGSLLHDMLPSAVGSRMRVLAQQREQAANVIGGVGQSGLTLPAHQSAHQLIGQGLAHTWSSLLGQQAHGTKGGIQGASHEATFSNRAGGAAAAAAGHVAALLGAGHRKVPVLPWVQQQQQQNPGQTQLQQAYPAARKQQWINKFAAEDVPGLDVFFDSRAPSTQLPPLPISTSLSASSTAAAADAVSATQQESTATAPPVGASATTTTQPILSPSKLAKHGRRSGAAPSPSSSSSTGSVVAQAAPSSGSSRQRHNKAAGASPAEAAAITVAATVPAPEAFRLAHVSEAVLTRPFMLRHGNVEVGGTMSAAAVAGDGAGGGESPPSSSLAQRVRHGMAELGLAQLADVGGLSAAVAPLRIDLTARPQPVAAMQPHDHAQVQLVNGS